MQKWIFTTYSAHFSIPSLFSPEPLLPIYIGYLPSHGHKSNNRDIFQAQRRSCRKVFSPPRKLLCAQSLILVFHHQSFSPFSFDPIMFLYAQPLLKDGGAKAHQNTTRAGLHFYRRQFIRRRGREGEDEAELDV